MDISFRKERVEKFFHKLSIPFTKLVKDLLIKWGVSIVEDLKCVEEDMLDLLFEVMSINHVLRCKLSSALKSLNDSGDYDPFLGASLPLHDNDKHADANASEGAAEGADVDDACKKKSSTSKKRISDMGGNLKKMTSFFPQAHKKKMKGKEHSTSPILNRDVIDLCMDDGNEVPAVAGLLDNAVDWRNGRLTRDTMDNLMRVDDPAPAYEKVLWDRTRIPTIQQQSLSNDFEDIRGLYKRLGPGLSRTSSDKEIDDAVKRAKAKYRADAILYHPDKNPGNDTSALFQEVNERWVQVQEVVNRFNAAGTGGASGRLLYDMKCDAVKACWSIEVQYNDTAAQETFATEQRTAKRKTTKQTRRVLSNFDKCVTLYNKRGWQTNAWRVVVSKAVNENKTRADITRAIRMQCGSAGWDGVAKNNQEYLTIFKKVTVTVDMVKSKKLDLDKLDAMSPTEKEIFLKSTRVSIPDKTKAVPSVQYMMEVDLFQYCSQMRNKGVRLSRMVVFRKVNSLYPLFKGGPTSDGYMSKVKAWFYHGFVKRYNLSYARISGASRKLPQGWQEKAANISARVGRTQLETRVGNTIIPAIPDSAWCNTDHLPVYRDMPGNYSWGEKGSGRRQVQTGGAEKERFTVQLSCLKDGTKLPIFMIFKGASMPASGRPRRNSVLYELTERLPDNFGNDYPPESKVVLTCSPTANSNQELTVVILQKVIFPNIGILEGKRGGVLVDDFKGHSTDLVKGYTTSFMSSNDADVGEQYPLCAFEIMAGGITPKSQPIDAITGKIFKGFYRDLYEIYMLNAPENARGQPIAPSRQLCAQWSVAAWDQVSEELIRKSWRLSGYKTISELQDVEGSINTLTVASQENMAAEVERVAGREAADHFTNPENELDDFENDDEEGTWDII